MKRWKQLLVALLAVVAVVTVFAVSSVEANSVQSNQIRVVGASSRRETQQVVIGSNQHQQLVGMEHRGAGSATVVVSGSTLSVWINAVGRNYPLTSPTVSGTAGTGISTQTGWHRHNVLWGLIPGHHAW